MTTKQKLELMKEIDRNNAKRIAEYIESVKSTAKPSGNGDAA